MDAALALPADAVAYYGPTAAKAAANIENTSRALRAGKERRHRGGLGLCGRVDRVRIQEILDYSTCTGDYTTMDFGEPRIVIEQCNRITSAAAPDWPRPGRHNLHRGKRPQAARSEQKANEAR